MDTLEQDLDLAIDSALKGLSTPDRDVAAAAQMHLEEAISQERRALAAEKSGRAQIQELQGERQRLIQAHSEAMGRLAADIAAVNARTRQETATAMRLAAASRAALEALSR